MSNLNVYLKELKKLFPKLTREQIIDCIALQQEILEDQYDTYISRQAIMESMIQQELDFRNRREGK